MSNNQQMVEAMYNRKNSSQVRVTTSNSTPRPIPTDTVASTAGSSSLGVGSYQPPVTTAIEAATSSTETNGGRSTKVEQANRERVSAPIIIDISLFLPFHPIGLNG
jgi:hypothetical protein